MSAWGSLPGGPPDMATDKTTAAPASHRTCPVLRINKFDDAIKFDRSQSILNAPEMFAGLASDPVNGEINVREFLEGSVVFMDGARHRDRRKQLNRLLRPDALDAIREDVILPAAERLL